MRKIDEIALISRCVLADDRQAFGTLVEAYQPRLRRFFLNLTLGDAMLSDDLAQETFIKAYINLRSFRGMASFSTWLFRIGYNEFYAHKRKHAEESITADLPQPRVDPQSRTDAEIDISTVMAALSPAERTAATLFYIDDLTVSKIATIMQVPAGTVKSHLHRARSKMTEILKKDLI